MRASLIILSCSLAATTAIPTYAQNAQSVRLGEVALTFAAGSIRQEMPLEGVVNVITGDNQTSGNRMMIGWTGTDTLYLKLKNPGDAALGDLYTVYRRSSKVFHPITKQYLGYIINRLGVVEVIQLDPKLVGVRVVRSYSPISPGDAVMRFTPPAMEHEVDTGTPAGDVEAMVIALQADKNMSLVSQGNLVYIDRGRADGLRAGDFLEVIRTGGGLPERRVGTVKVLSTEPHTAATVLSQATSRVLVGDRLRSKAVSLMEAMSSGSGDANGSSALVQREKVASVGSVPLPVDPQFLSNVRIDRARRGTVINLDDLADQLEYESGEVKVMPAGIPILQQLTDYLKATALHQQVRVEGHSDNMEIGPTLKGRFPTNWELSKARAAGIVRYLIEKGGMDSAKISAVGYGASRPVASNATDEGRRKNRRIELVIETSEEVPTAQPVSTPLPEERSNAAQVSFNETDVQPIDQAGSAPTPATSFEPAASDAQLDRGAPPAEMAPPGASTGAEPTTVQPGL